MGYIWSDRSFPTSQGWMVEFDYAMYGSYYGFAGDGISFFLWDATEPFQIGAGGGCIGYCGVGGFPGLPGGYVGVALDEFGNFGAVNSWEERPSGAVSIRGNAADGYPVLAVKRIDGGLQTFRPGGNYYHPDDGRAEARRVRISSTDNRHITVEMKRPQAPWVTIHDSIELPGPVPERLKVGMAGVSGATNIVAEVRRFTGTLPIDYAVTVDDGGVNARRGQPHTWDVRVKNDSEATPAQPLEVVLSSSERLDNVTWTCRTASGASCGAGSGLTATATSGVPAGETYVFAVKGTPAATAQFAELTATAVNTDPAATDIEPSNDTATDRADIRAASPTARAGADQTVSEGSLVELDGSASTDPEGSPLTYRWKLVSGTGPTPVLTTTTGVKTQFQAVDDGTWTFRLTADNGLGDPGTDEVTVRATNKAPTVPSANVAGQQAGPSLLAATIADDGTLDRQSAVVDWGDGTAPQMATVSSGAGWASVSLGHRYAAAGSFQVRLTVTDDDGGSVTRTQTVTIARPTSIWANSTSDPFLGHAFTWLGLGGKLTGTLHSNASVKIAGLGNTVEGGIEYAKNYWRLGVGITVPTATKVAPSSPPAGLAVNDFRPGGPVATELGTKYRDMTSSCRFGVWSILTPGELADGVYYAPCNITISAFHARGRVTLVSTGKIHFFGDDSVFTPFYRGVLALSNRSGGDAIDAHGAGSRLVGLLDGRNGDVELSGANLRVSCGVIGNQVSITGADVRVDGSDCSPPSGTVADVRMIPELQTSLAVDRDAATPGDQLRYSATVTNAGGDVFLSGIAGVQNSGTASAQVASSAFELQYQSPDKQWRTLSTSAAAQRPSAITTTAMSSPGVTYGSSSPAGTTVAAGSLAAWAYQARVPLTADEAKLLWDPAKAIAVRSVLRLNLTGDAQARELAPLGEDITTLLRAASPDATSAKLYVAPPSGDVKLFSAPSTPALGRIAPGQSQRVTLDHALAAVAPRAPNESVSAYLERLRTADGAAQRGTLYAQATAGGVPITGPTQRVTTTRNLPIVKVALDGPKTLTTGAQAPFKLTLDNAGAGPASALTVTDEATGGASVTLTGVPAQLTAGQRAEATATLTAPGIPASVRQTATASWKDANGNVYGSVQAAANTSVRTPAALRLTKTVRIAVDPDGNDRASAGDTLEYTVVAENTGASPLTGLTVTDPVPAALDADGSSVSSTQGTAELVSVAGGGEEVRAAIGTVAGGDEVTLRFRATVRPLAAGAREVVIDNQAIAISDQLTPTTSDDPGTADVGDPTRTRVTASAAKLDLSLETTLVVDADGNDAVSPGDTLRVRLIGRSVGDRSATGVVLQAPVPTYTSLVPGTLESTGGAVQLENGVPTGRLSRVPAGDRFGIGFEAKVDGTVPVDIDRLVTRGSAATNELGIADATPVETPLVIPAQLRVTKTGELAEDRDGNGAVSSGDVVGYRVIVTNPNATIARGVTLTDEFDSFTTLVSGSLALTQGTSSVTGRTITATIGDLAAAGSATLTYRVLVGQVPPGTFGLSSQAGASSTNTAGSKSDDPSSGGAQDPTTVPVVATPQAPPSLSARKRSWVAVDADADGKPSPGDTIALEVTVVNDGPGGASGVVADDAIDPNATLVVGSVQTPPVATVLKGNTAGDAVVKVNLGSIAAGASAVFSYQVTVNPMPAGATTIGSSGSVASNEVAPVKPTGPGTMTPVTLPDLVPPTIRIVDPIDGATVTAPTPVRADITPPAGQEIAEWCVFAQRAGDAERRTVKCGSGAPAGRDLTTFDPTVLPNGTYTLTVDATADGGGAGFAQVAVVVSGALKPGRYAVSYTDMDLPIQTLPIRVTRSYDSFDKSKGDFGIGWRVGLDGFRVSVNRPLGEAGWASRESNCMVLLGQRLCTSTDYEDLRSHVVTVTWPDGHTEAFDFTPTANTGGVVLGGTAGFTARKGATSKLKVVGDGAVTFLADGNLYETDQDTIFNPQRFELTAKDNTRYVLDTATGLVSSIDPHGNTLEVDEDGIRSSLGTNVTFTRDGQGRITRISGPSGEKRTYVYSQAGDLITVTDSLDHSVKYEYDGDHNITRTIDPSGRPMRTIEYDADGRITAITDARGNTTSLSVDVNDRSSLVSSADGRLTTITTTDDRGNPIRVQAVSDGLTRTTRYEYDGNDNLTKSVTPLGHTTTFGYDGRSNLIEETDAAGNKTALAYDDHDRVVKVTGPTGGSVQVMRNEFGEPTRVVDASGSTYTSTYDNRGNRTSTSDPLGNTTVTGFDGSGNPISVTDPMGSTTQTGFDLSGRPVSILAPDAGLTRLEYDPNGRATRLIDALGHTREYRYDALGRLTFETDPLGRVTESSYDAAGNLSRTTDRNGAVHAYSYDAENRMTRSDRGGRVTEYSYGAGGELTEASGADATVALTYDADDNVTEFTTSVVGGASQSVSYAYDANSRRRAMAYGGVTDQYFYDASGSLTRVASAQLGNFDFTRDASGRVTRLQRPNGVSTSFAYDAAGRALSVVAAKGGAELDGVRYQFDANGRRTSKAANDGVHSFAFDRAGHLLSADNPGTANDEAYAYDALGNRTSTGEQYSAAGELLSRGGWTYTYDAEGRTKTRTNVGSGETTRFAWNAENQLQSVQRPDGTTTSYRYDPFGRRVQTSDATATRQQVFGLDDNKIADRVNGAQVARFTSALTLDSPLGQRVGTTNAYVQQDAMANVTSLTDDSGQVSARFTYGAFGQPLSATGTTRSPFSFAGREWNAESGTYDNRARQYDPLIGRFLSEDALPAANKYWYADSDPVDFLDPTGNNTEAELGEVQTIQAQLAGGTIITGNVVVIGRTTTLKALEAEKGLVQGEYTLLNQLPKQATTKANYAQNARVLYQNTIGRGVTRVRDADPGDMSGLFLNYERRLLQSWGYKWNDVTKFWELL